MGKCINLLLNYNITLSIFPGSRQYNEWKQCKSGQYNAPMQIAYLQLLQKEIPYFCQRKKYHRCVSLFSHLLVILSRCSVAQRTFKYNSFRFKYSYSHSSQFSLPVIIHFPFLLRVQFSWHVRQKPLLLHVAQPVGQATHS